MDFTPQSIFISNNESYVGVIDQNKLFVYDSKSTKVIYTTVVPPIIQEKEDPYGDESDNSHSHHGQIVFKDKK